MMAPCGSHALAPRKGGGTKQRRFIRLQRVATHNAQTPTAPIHQRFEQRQEARILLDGGHTRAGFEQRAGKPAGAGADLEDVFAVEVASCARNAAGDVHVEQKMLAESLGGFLKSRASLDTVRKIAAAGTGFDDGLWKGLVEQGIAGLMVGEQHGGLGLTVLDAAVVAETLGYGAAPVAFAGSLVMAPLALRLSGSAAQQDTWLPPIALGEVRIGLAFAVLWWSFGNGFKAVAPRWIAGIAG